MGIFYIFQDSLKNAIQRYMVVLRDSEELFKNDRNLYNLGFYTG